ncbi:MAG: rod shape-determining protein RodA [Bacteroidota bacterium]|jgi:rod shape determining protein RodA|nr:rod shape-determining protein RodA [Bacteroidota bacterium]
MAFEIRTINLRMLDWIALGAVLLLVAAGLLSIYSATHNAEIFIKFQKQVFWSILGILLLVLVLLAPPRFYHYIAYPAYALSLLLLLLVLLLGKTIAGNAGWFGIGGYGIQPSEFAKLTTILALGRFLSDSTTSMRSFGDLGKAIGIVGVPWLLILLQPDFGTGLVYWAFFLAMIFWAGAEMVLLLTLLSPVIVAVLSIIGIWYFLAAAFLVSILFYLIRRNLGIALMFLALNLSIGFGVQYMYSHLPEYQKNRIAVFIDPTEAPLAAGYNVIQSKVAIGSGGMTGKGYLQGSQTQLRFVPEQWTDFIFCVPAEEFGFIGAMGILLLFAILLLRGLRMARVLEFRFSSLTAIGITTMFLFHVFINVGMTQGLLPVVGIPLPFMSYGGSFFLTSLVAVGILQHSWASRDEFS